MASKNVLLGSGVDYSIYESNPTVPIPEPYTPRWMYSKEHPEGKIVYLEEDFLRLCKEGWTEHPENVRR